MDALSRLLALYPAGVALDYRCHLAAPWRLDEPAMPAGVAPYHLIVTGEAWLEMSGLESVALQAGDIVVLPHGSAHCLRTWGAATAQGIAPPRVADQRVTDQTIHTRGNQDTMRRIVNDGSGPVTDVLCGRFLLEDRAAGLLGALPPLVVIKTADRPELAGMRTLVDLLHCETERMQPGASSVASHLAAALFSLMVRAWLNDSRATTMPGMFALLAEQRLRNAVEMMLAAPGSPWTMAELAAACHVSRATFARLFRRVAGKTVGEVLLLARMEQAAQWLAQDRYPLAEIGEKSGYQSEAAFNRAFKIYFGMTPGQYRSRQRKPAVASGSVDGQQAARSRTA